MKIKELRLAAGLTQQAFSDLIHVPKRTIENWEYGKSQPTECLLFLIEYYLKNEGYI